MPVEAPPSIVQKLYDNNIRITNIELANEIVKYDELTPLDLWLLPQYPFNQWRRKYQYPDLLKKLKGRRGDLTTWMTEQGLTDEHLLNGYFSDFFENKPSKEKTIYLIKVSYKGEVENQVWHSYKGQTQRDGDGEPVIYEFIKEFISFYDWLFAKGEVFNFIAVNRYEPLYRKIWLPDMGNMVPPMNGVGMLLRGKKLEFMDVSGLDLNGPINFGSMGNLEFAHCYVDNLKCTDLDMPHLYLENCSVNNMQIRNSNIDHWNFFNCNTTGNIIDSTLSYIRIYGGQFTPNFINSEISPVDVNHKKLPYNPQFEKTYRSIAKALKDAGNKNLSAKMKIAEYDFIRGQANFVRKCLMTFEKIFWGYGQKPKRLILVILATVILFGVFYSFFPTNFKESLANQPYYKIFYNAEYYSAVTFTTLGYGDIAPTGFIKLFAALEALFGAITLGFLVAGLSRNE